LIYSSLIPKAEKSGLFGEQGVGKTVIIMELINNIAKGHSGFSVFWRRLAKEQGGK